MVNTNQRFFFTMLELPRLYFNNLLIDVYLQSVSKLKKQCKFMPTSDVNIIAAQKQETNFNHRYKNNTHNLLKPHGVSIKLKILDPEPIDNNLFHSDDKHIFKRRDDCCKSSFINEKAIPSTPTSSWKLFKHHRSKPEKFTENLELDIDHYPLPIITKAAQLAHIYLTLPKCFINEREANRSMLTPFLDFFYFYQQIQLGKTFYVVIQHGTRSLKISHHYILTTINPLELVLRSYSKNYTVNLLQTEIISIPLIQIPNWKYIVLYETQKANGHLKLVNFKNYLKQNNSIQISLYDKSKLIFDLNLGILIIPNHKTCMHRNSFHELEYNKLLSQLAFKMMFLEEIVILTYPNKDCTKFVKEVNCWSNHFEDKSNMYIYKSVKFNDSILYANDVIYFNEECFMILYYNRFELYKKNYKHRIRSYLNNSLDLKFKLIFSAKWNDVCSSEQELNNIDKPCWFLLCVSYIRGDGLIVLNNPKFFNFASETVLQKRKWLQYVYYLKIVV